MRSTTSLLSLTPGNHLTTSRHAPWYYSSVGALEVNLRTNLYGPIFVTQEFIGDVEKSKQKRVVYHSSYAGSLGAKMYVLLSLFLETLFPQIKLWV